MCGSCQHVITQRLLAQGVAAVRAVAVIAFGDVKTAALLQEKARDTRILDGDVACTCMCLAGVQLAHICLVSCCREPVQWAISAFAGAMPCHWLCMPVRTAVC
jgi:hypothetical protein